MCFVRILEVKLVALQLAKKLHYFMKKIISQTAKLRIRRHDPISDLEGGASGCMEHLNFGAKNSFICSKLLRLRH